MAVGQLRLADKSAWEQARYDERARVRITELSEARQLATCVVAVAEMLYSSRNLEDMERTQRQLATLHSLPVTEAAERGVQASMLGLAARGQHRMPIPDLLLAAIAQAHGAVVLHYDADFERIAEVTGQRHEWIVPRETGHGTG